VQEQPPIKFVVGLGNPGRRYHRTRHNVGFMVLKELRRRWEFGRARSKFHARLWSGRIGPQGVALVAPQTYMNASGRAVAEVMGFYRLPPALLLVVLDDLALPLGCIRARAGGSAGGHKGLTDVLDAVGTRQLPRLRVGIGSPPPGTDAVEYVLSPFGKAEQEVIAKGIVRAADAVADWVTRGMTYVMNHYNQRVQDAPNG